MLFPGSIILAKTRSIIDINDRLYLSGSGLSNSAEDLALQGGDGQRGWRSRPKSLFLAYHPVRTAAQRFTIVLSAQKNDNDPYATTTSLPIRTPAPC